ncbi:serine hydrolase domain-containing protein [Pedobacter metabolipauper]|nr:serine hydrolase [Pedobacter metabolipauper]
MRNKMILLKAIIVIFLLTSGIARSQTANRSAILAAMTESILKDKDSGIHSILIKNDDTIDYARYFNGFTKDSIHDTRSSFKSVTSLLVAIAIDQGLIKSTNQKMIDFFPEYVPIKNNNNWKKSITIQHLLDMRSGFDCGEFNDGKDCETPMSETNNWVKFSLDLPMKNKPGTVFAYTSCNPMIISGIISKVSHMSVMDFAAKYLFAPLGISRYRWTVDLSGNGMTAGSFFMLPEDMVKIGQLVRDGGKWKGKQVITKKSIDHATNANQLIPDFSYARVSKSQNLIPQNAFYGGFWYRERIKTKALDEELLFTSGNGGQYIFVIKNLHLVVVFTQGNYGSWKAKKAFDLLGSYILPAFRLPQKT